MTPADVARRVALGCMLFHGCLAWVALAEAVTVAGFLWLLARLSAEPHGALILGPIVLLGSVFVGLCLVASGYHFCCAWEHRREAREP